MENIIKMDFWINTVLFVGFVIGLTVLVCIVKVGWKKEGTGGKDTGISSLLCAFSIVLILAC